MGERVNSGCGIGHLERRDQPEKLLAPLCRGDLAPGERPAVADGRDGEIHIEIDIAGPQEVAVQRVQGAVVGDAQLRCRQALAEKLAAEHPLALLERRGRCELSIADGFERDEVGKHACIQGQRSRVCVAAGVQASVQRRWRILDSRTEV